MNKLGMRLKERLNRSAFFFGAVLFHLVIFLMILGYVVFPSPPHEPDVVIGPPPKYNPPTPPKAPPTDSAAQAAASSINEISAPLPAPGVPITPIHPSDPFDKSSDLNPGSQLSHEPGPPAPPMPPQGSDNPWVNLEGVKQAQLPWHVDGQPGKFVIPIYLAKYADGDWDCNSFLHDGKLASGCLPNLMAKIQEWSDGDIKTRDLKVVALDSPQILNEAPPFIFFTGHRDFRLTEAEVKNLRSYLQIGGCIWGDSAFAGDGSRFDVAFHREMKRVIPDPDLNFEPLPTDHDIFTPKTKFTIEDLPKGMNQRADPIEGISLGGKLAILYTPNDYSDMMTMLLLPGRNEREAQMDGWNHWEPQHPLFTPGQFTWNAATYFRNYDPPAVMSTYKLSMNILIHLLHRYDDALLLTP